MTQGFPAKRVRGLPAISAPAIPERQMGPDPEVTRLNLNEAPMKASPKALQAAVDAMQFSNRYPDHGCTSLAEKIADLNNFPVEDIIFGTGSSELLMILAAASLNEGQEAIFPDPTFPTGLKASRIAGADLVKVPVTTEGANDIPAMLEAITEKTGLFYICNPNNPTGNLASKEAIELAVHQVPETCMLMVDEAYYEFGAIEGGPNVLELIKSRKGPWAITRSMSKAYCLAGMRVGYAFVSGADVREPLNMLRGNFNINRIALAASEAAIQDQGHMKMVLSDTIKERTRLSDLLRDKGFQVRPSFTNFIVAQPPGPAEPISKNLAEQKIMSQFMPWPNSDGSLRITVGSPEETDRLIAALD